MANLLDLAEAMRAKAVEVEEAASNLAVNLATVILNDLLEHTPVDETVAVSNWQVSLNNPRRSVIPAYHSGISGYTRPESVEAAFSDAQNTLRTKKPGQVIWITNNVDYMTDLNDGSSRQEPAGMFERAMVVGRKHLASHR